MAIEIVDKKKEPEEVKRKTLEKLFNEPCTIWINRGQLHQAFQIPGGSTENTISGHRRGTQGLELVYHPGYGLIGRLKGKYFITPGANLIYGAE